MNKEELLNRFIDLIPRKFKNNTRSLFSVGFIGINGVGKSFVAEKLSEKIGLYIANNDKIRRFLNESGFNDTDYVQKLVFDMGPKLSAHLYANKLSHIIDADIVQFHDITRKNAMDHGARLCIIHLICPENVILERINKREKDIAKNPLVNFSRAGKDEYFKRKALHQSLLLPEVFFTVDTSLDVDIQLNKVVNKLKKEKLI
ncbi:MAG: AAA family ATPase [Candidatus Moranbacteria bacterium]|jgi:predicted kinase|nr:AAA family ATPase [Candidatus Moranbacteria bacterium]